MTIALLFAAAAAAVYLWPTMSKAPVTVKPLEVVPPLVTFTKAPTYRSAIESLAYVRTRLINTENLTEAAKSAVDTLTLALVAGSDKE
jgi:hypothetical protein